MPKTLKKKETFHIEDNEFFTSLARKNIPYQPSVFEQCEIIEEENTTIQPPTFVQPITITLDTTLHPWIYQIPENERNEKINRYIQLGYMLHGMTQTTMQADTFIKPIQDNLDKKITELEHKTELNLSVMNTRVNENLDRVKTSIDKFTEFTHKSSFKGAMGENLVQTIIQQYFPDDTIENTSQKTAEADYHMKCHNGVMFLIESKFYTSIVNKQELEKFRRDLLKTGFPIGIFISLSSGIVGKKRFDIEKLNAHQMILYVPNAGFDGSSVVWSILFAKEIVRYVIEQKMDVENEMGNFQDMYDSFQEIYQHFSSLKMQIMDTRNHVMRHMDDLYHKTLEIHLQIHHLIGTMKNKIQRQLYIFGNLQMRDMEMHVEEALQKIEESNDTETLILYQKLKEFSGERGIQIHVEEENHYVWYGYLGSEEIYRIKTLTKKKEIVIMKYKMTMLLTMENLELLGRIIPL
jgi:hypothetical protein